MDAITIFGLGARGVNVVTAPPLLTKDELTSAQNVEFVSDKGEGGLDQRPGMTRINASPLGGSVLFAQDMPSDLLLDKTPTLYAGMYTGSTHNWRKSTDGTTWTNADTPAKPFSNNASITLFLKRFPKCATVGRKLYYPDGSTPIAIRSWDGTTDVAVATIPPSVSGVSISTPGAPVEFSGGTAGATTYTYRFVAVNGGSTSIGSATTSVTGGATLGNGTGGTTYIAIRADSGGTLPVSGATRYDVYRTAGGATQGKIGSIPIVAGAFTTGNGSGDLGFAENFSDQGLVGDGTIAPVAAIGVTSGDAIGVLDLITDGVSLYVAVLDAVGADPSPTGRILQLAPATGAWTQIGSTFVTSSGNGTASAFAMYDGALVYGTATGITSGNTSYLAGTGTPLPAGGFPEVHTTAASQMTCSLAVFQGILYAGYASLVAGTAAIVAKRTPVATWATSLTAVATAQFNGYTSLGVFNGSLFAGWTSGGGATAANIKSTLDGTTWTAEITLGVGEVPCQMVTFGGNLYVVCGRTGVGYNTTTRILKRTTAGTWSAVDDPADDFAGCLGVVYV